MTVPEKIERESDALAEDDKYVDVWATLAAVQAELSTIPKDKVNPYHGSKFVGLDTLIEVTRPLFERFGLVWSTAPTSLMGDEPGLRFTLRHLASRTEISDVMPLTLSKPDPQAQGSAITYARRYALQCVLDIVGEDEDDDGQAATASSSHAVADDGGASNLGATVNLQSDAKGLRDEAINAAFQKAGLVPQAKPWGLLGRVPEAHADALREALKLQRQMA